MQKLKEVTGFKNKYLYFSKSNRNSSRDKNVININVISGSGSKTRSLGSSIRVLLNVISSLFDANDDDNDSNDSYNLQASYLSKDFEKILERRYYSDGLRH